MMLRSTRRTATAAALLFAGSLLAACGNSSESAGSTRPEEKPSPTTSGHGHGSTADAPEPVALRQGERFRTVRMPTAYTPKAPYGTGTDDYRCFLLDPKLGKDAFLTGVDVQPGNADVVHHVILFQVGPEQLDAARGRDRAEKGPGWTCFGGTGLEGPGSRLDQAPWIGAWAPGGGESVHQDGVGVPLKAGSRIVMQVHYNLLAGQEPDTSGAKLRLVSGDADLESLHTVLLPAPVELPCRPGKTGALCDRAAAMADVKKRFGAEAGMIGEYLHFPCGAIKPGEVQSCTWPAQSPMTIRAAAGHMHLLGQSISVDVNGEKVLDIDHWNFDDQGSEPVDPVDVKPGDKVTVTCRHAQEARDRIPSLRGTEERYVVWGEGTTDEMCLGILLATRP